MPSGRKLEFEKYSLFMPLFRQALIRCMLMVQRPLFGGSLHLRLPVNKGVALRGLVVPHMFAVRGRKAWTHYFQLAALI